MEKMIMGKMIKVANDCYNEWLKKVVIDNFGDSITFGGTNNDIAEGRCFIEEYDKALSIEIAEVAAVSVFEADQETINNLTFGHDNYECYRVEDIDVVILW